MPPRPKLPGMPPGNPTFARLARVEARVDQLEVRVDDHDAELAALDLDIRDLTAIALRSSLRARLRLTRRRRRARR